MLWELFIVDIIQIYLLMLAKNWTENPRLIELKLKKKESMWCLECPLFFLLLYSSVLFVVWCCWWLQPHFWKDKSVFELFSLSNASNERCRLHKFPGKTEGENKEGDKKGHFLFALRGSRRQERRKKMRAHFVAICMGRRKMGPCRYIIRLETNGDLTV